MRKVAGEENIVCRRRLKRGLMDNIAVRAVAACEHQPVRKIRLLLEQGECLYQFDMLFFFACHSTCVDEIRALDGERLYVYCLLAFYGTRIEQTVVNAVMDHFHMLVLYTEPLKVLPDILACRYDAVCAGKPLANLLSQPRIICILKEVAYNVVHYGN